MKLIKVIALIVLVQTIFTVTQAMESPSNGDNQEEGAERPSKRRKIESSVMDTLLEALQTNNLDLFLEALDEYGDRDELDADIFERLLSKARENNQLGFINSIELVQKNVNNDNWQQCLTEAVASGNLGSVQEIVKENGIGYDYAFIFGDYKDEGRTIKESTDKLITALSIALENKQDDDKKEARSKIVRWLVDHTTERTDDTQAALAYALWNRDYAFAEYLISIGFATAQTVRCYHKEPTEIEFLLEHGMTPSHLSAGGSDIVTGLIAKWIRLGGDESYLNYARWFLLHGFYTDRPNYTLIVPLPEIAGADWVSDLLPDNVLEHSYNAMDVVKKFVKSFFKDFPISSALILQNDATQTRQFKSFIEQTFRLESTINELITPAGRGSCSLKTILERLEVLSIQIVRNAFLASGVNSQQGVYKELDQKQVAVIKHSIAKADSLQKYIFAIIMTARSGDPLLQKILEQTLTLTAQGIYEVMNTEDINNQIEKDVEGVVLSHDELSTVRSSRERDILSLENAEDLDKLVVEDLRGRRQRIIDDLNNALIITAGRGHSLFDIILGQAQILIPQSIGEALYAAGINNHASIFKVLLNHNKLTTNELQRVLPKLLRPFAITGNRELLALLLQVALRQRIMLDILPVGKIVDKLLGSEIVSDERKEQYRAIRRMLAEYLQRRNYIRALERTAGGPALGTIATEDLPKELQERKPQAYYVSAEKVLPGPPPEIELSSQLPTEILTHTEIELSPQLPSELITYIMGYVLARYNLVGSGRK